MLCYALLLSRSICHLAPFEKPTDCTNLKSFPKSPRKLLITLMYSLTDVSLFYHYNITITISGHLSLTCISPKQRDTFDTMRPPTASPKWSSPSAGPSSWHATGLYIWIQSQLLCIWSIWTTRMPLCIYSLLYITLPTAECVYAYMYHTRTFMEHHVTCIDLLGANLVFV